MRRALVVTVLLFGACPETVRAEAPAEAPTPIRVGAGDALGVRVFGRLARRPESARPARAPFDPVRWLEERKRARRASSERAPDR